MTRGKLRRRLRARFCEVYRDLIIKARNEPARIHGKMSPSHQAVADKMREVIGYSPKTVDCDIVCSIFRTAKQVYGE